MAKYQKQSTMTGTWLKAGDLKNGTEAKIVSETVPSPSSFLDKNGNTKTQDVCKVRVAGLPEAFNVSLNRATINALVDAFGDDSLNWQNKPLTIETEKVRVAGKAVVAVYFIPAGYQKVDDANGYAMIIRNDDQNEIVDAGGPIDPMDVPF